MGFRNVLIFRDPDVLSTVVPPERLRRVELEMENNQEKYPPMFMVDRKFKRHFNLGTERALKEAVKVVNGFAEEVIRSA
jgi:hypothetical protein